MGLQVLFLSHDRTAAPVEDMLRLAAGHDEPIVEDEERAAFQWVNPKAWSMALTAVTVYAASQSLQAVAFVALVFGVINLPSTAVWALVGGQLKRFLIDPVRLRAFNIVMALLLVASLYPVLAP